jgi:HTH-type transcriptional regulator / antitoxin MqsA
MSKVDYAVVPEHVCAACGANGTLAQGVRDVPFTYRNQSTVIPAVHGLYCTQCNEGFADAHYPQDWQRMGDAIHAFSQQVDAATASELREIRLKLGLRQSDAGKLFGGGATAFSEYERGKTQPHKSTVLLLKLLGKHPELLDEIKAA